MLTNLQVDVFCFLRLSSADYLGGKNQLNLIPMFGKIVRRFKYNFRR